MGLKDDLHVTLTLTNGATVPIDRDTITELRISEELSDTKNGVIGNVTTNEVEIIFTDNEGLFNTSNTSSPYYNYLKGNIKVTLNDGATQLGVYYTDILKNTDFDYQKEVLIIAQDRLGAILGRPVETTLADKAITVRNFVTKIFSRLGVLSNDLVIENGLLNETIDFTTANTPDLETLLNHISIACDCNIFVGRDNKIHFTSKTRSGVAVRTYTPDTRLRGIISRQDTRATPNALRLQYGASTLSEPKKVFELPTLEVDTGTRSFQKYEMKEKGVFSLERGMVTSTSNTEITSLSIDSDRVSFTLHNPSGYKDIVKFEVYGRLLEFTEVTTDVSNESLIALYGRNELTISSSLIQSEQQANAIKGKIWSRLSQSDTIIIIETRDLGFTVNLNDIIQVEDSSVGLSFKGYVQRLKADWIGGNTCSHHITLYRI